MTADWTVQEARSPLPQGDASVGLAQIEWVRRHSPVLDGHVRQILSDGSLKGRRIAVVVHLEAKTAFLATILADAGAEVVVAGSNPRTTRGDIVEALKVKGLDVVARVNGSHESWERELLAAADREPEFIIDDGAELTTRIHDHRPDLWGRIVGVSEETTTGTTRLKALHQAEGLPFRCLTANDARCKHLFDNRYATGQTSLQAICKLTNRQLAGARVAVIGYGHVGKGLALYARAMGARTFVVEVDPVRALEAHFDGHTVGAAADVLPEATIVITATGGMHAVSAEHIDLLRDNVVLANAGHHDLEIDHVALASRAGSVSQPRWGVTTYRVGDKDIHLLIDGALVNIAGGMGHQVEVMDLTFAVQGIGVHHLINTELPHGVNIIPQALDDQIAEAKLAAMGVTLDALGDDQADDVSRGFGA